MKTKKKKEKKSKNKNYITLFFTLTGIYKVCLSDVNMTLGQKTCDQFRSEFGDTHITFVQCDVTSTTSGNIHKPRGQLRGEGG